MQLNKKFLPLIIAGVLGLVATFLINSYVQQQADAAKQNVIASQKSLAKVVVARDDIPAGTTISEAMLKEESVHKDILQPRAATSIDRVIDKVALAPISKGEQILLNKIAFSGQEVSLASKVPKGKRAITVTVDNISSVGGMVRPGDHVDIVGVIPQAAVDAEGKQVTQLATVPLFQNVLVLAVGSDFAGSAKASSGSSVSPLITFALAPEEANLVAFVQDQGKIRLLLRSPGDAQVQQVAPASWPALFRQVNPQAFDAAMQQQQQEAAIPKPTERKNKVDIYRGTQKEVKELP